jgi:hypothetical protein
VICLQALRSRKEGNVRVLVPSTSPSCRPASSHKSLTECRSGTTHKLPFSVNTTGAAIYHNYIRQCRHALQSQHTSQDAGIVRFNRSINYKWATVGLCHYCATIAFSERNDGWQSQLINCTDDERSGLADIGRPEGGQDSKSGQRQGSFQRRHPRHPWVFFMWPQYSTSLSPLRQPYSRKHARYRLWCSGL